MGKSAGLQNIHERRWICPATAKPHKDTIVVVSVIQLSNLRVKIQWLKRDLKAQLLEIGQDKDSSFHSRVIIGVSVEHKFNRVAVSIFQRTVGVMIDKPDLFQ